jgi:hypothetical protein
VMNRRDVQGRRRDGCRRHETGLRRLRRTMFRCRRRSMMRNGGRHWTHDCRWRLCQLSREDDGEPESQRHDPRRHPRCECPQSTHRSSS